jgi:pimeloyl-ACP methyl ester carboxylesterase
MPFPYRDETKELNDLTRRGASGSFIRLPTGVTHYELGGQGAKVIALVHGFSVPYFIYDPTFEFLTKSGFRVLRYDLFGRGWSDRPRARYNIDLFVKQLHDLLDALHLEAVDLVGLSMGGPITASFADHYPERVNKMILIDPVVHAVGVSKLLKAAILPGIGELVLGLAGSESMVKSVASDFFGPELVAQFQERYRVQMQFKGFKRAILSSIRNRMLGSFFDLYRRVGRLNKPTLIIWGRNDATVPFEQSEDLLAVIPHAELLAVDNCRHIPHYEKPQIVNPRLLEFLK